MKTIWKSLVSLGILLSELASFAQPIDIHPENPHYFIYKDKPAVLITSGEHYGAVINGAFDYKKYLKTLAEEGMNYTRIFTGTYWEFPNAHGIRYNTLAPEPGDLVLPWMQTNEQGLYPGLSKFDLDVWNVPYFKRLRDFVSEAENRDIIVEVTLFCSSYTDKLWKLSPFNAANNVNDFPAISREDIHTLANGKVLKYQKALVRKIVEELNAFDNVIYEIQNEPWADQPEEGMLIHKTLTLSGNRFRRMSELASRASLEWQSGIARTIVETENHFPKKHLIAQNYSNLYYPLTEIDSNVSILNFHYAWSEAAMMNYGWELPISFDESGFCENTGIGDTAYLRQAWEFMLAGGAVFNNLDYSFYCGYEEGNLDNQAPGGGSKALRKWLSILRDFMNSLEFTDMKSDPNVVYHAPGMRSQAFSDGGTQYALMFSDIKHRWVKLDLPEGAYQYLCVSPFTGQVLKKGDFKSDGKVVKWHLPDGFNNMVALKISKL